MKYELGHDLQYYLMSPSNPPVEFVEVHDRAFRSWIEILQSSFDEVGIKDTSHLHEDFMRQDAISCLCSGDEVISVFLHAFSSIHIDAARSFRYMKENFPETFFQKLKPHGISNVMTSNYLAVHPEWRRGQNKIQVAATMVGLSLRVRDLFGADGFIGVWRNDRKVNELAYAQGGECIIKDVYNHNTPCDLILMKSSTPYQYPNTEVEKCVNSLWDSRLEAFFKPKAIKERTVA